MTTEKMNIHKGLCELKIIDNRIEKEMQSVPMVVANERGNQKIQGIPVADFCDLIKSAFQSTTDLIARRDAIKRAIVKSNAETTVVIGGKVYTVAEAIEMKNHGLDLKRKLKATLTDHYNRSKRAADAANGQSLETRADNFIRNLYNTTDMSKLTEEATAERKKFIEAHTAELVDPIKVSEKIAALEEEIYNFSIEVDAALSSSNALTEIKIEY